MSVVKIKTNLCTTYILDFAKNFGRREWQVDITASIEH